MFEDSMNSSFIRDLDRLEHDNTDKDFWKEFNIEVSLWINPGETVKLPGKHLKFKYLHIPHSWKIIGRPETILEITGAIFIGSFKVNTQIWNTLNSDIEE